MTVVVKPSDVLEGDFDAPPSGGPVPQSFVVKGIFMKPLKDRLEDAWDDVAAELRRPPRHGHYVPFDDYPQYDHGVLTRAVVDYCYGAFSQREGLRRLAREDFGVLVASPFGKMMVQSVRNVHEALLLMPEVYAKVAPGDRKVFGEELDASTVALTWSPSYGYWEYQLGQIEGVIQYFGASYEIEVTVPEPQHFRYVVRHA